MLRKFEGWLSRQVQEGMDDESIRKNMKVAERLRQEEQGKNQQDKPQTKRGK